MHERKKEEKKKREDAKLKKATYHPDPFIHRQNLVLA